jgi:ferric-chelate reductase
MIAICREASYPQFSPVAISSWVKIPPLGIILLLLAYLAFLLALEFIDNNIPGAQHYTSLGVRASWLAVAQIPLLLLLAGKANLIGALVGVSYERLNVLHRWVSRGMLLLITLHFGYQSYGWNQYGLMQLEWQTDTCPPTGIAAYALLLWINFTSLAPIRARFYELFVVNHILSFIAFVYLVMAHIPSTALYARVWVYAGIGIFFLDRMIRTIRYAYHNARPTTATLTALDGGVTKIRVRSKQIKSWAPGAHVFLSIPRLGLGQSHPATIASIPSSHDGDLVFILKSHRGFTNRALKSASSEALVYADSKNEYEAQYPTGLEKTYRALIGGPYGGSQSDPAAFDTVLMISGSTGITFMLPNILSLAHRSRTASKLPLRVVDFVWVVKQVCWTSWVRDELAEAVNTLKDNGIEVRVTIYVTCDDSLTGLPSEKATTGCACDVSLDSCCCTTEVPTANLTEARKAHDDSEDIEVAAKGGNAKTDQDVGATTAVSSMDVSVGRELKVLPDATFVSGRPNFQDLVWELADQAEGEMGIFACGPLGLSTAIRNTVASISDERAVHKGTGAEGIYLHVEGFCW